MPAGLTAFRNEAFAPPLAEVPADVDLPSSGGLSGALGLDLSDLPPALPNDEGHLDWSGPVAADTSVFLSASSSDRWAMTVDGASAKRSEPFGWANEFAAPKAGDATLQFHTWPGRYGVLLLEIVAWLWVMRTLLRRRIERRTDGGEAA